MITLTIINPDNGYSDRIITVRADSIDLVEDCSGEGQIYNSIIVLRNGTCCKCRSYMSEVVDLIKEAQT